jgi:hypothetical protein
MESMEAPLKYLDAGHLDTPAGRLDGAVLVSPTKATLGRLDGVLIDPLRRKVRFYVFEPSGGMSSRHYLLPLTAARLDRQRRALEVDVEADEMDQLDEVEPERLPQFSDEDLKTADEDPNTAL